MNKQRRLYGALTLIGSLAFTIPATAGTVQGKGQVKGTGIAQGQGIVKGRGTASGTGVVVYRDDQGRVHYKKGTGTVSGRGIAIGRGTVAGRGKAAGQGRAMGQGRYRR